MNEGPIEALEGRADEPGEPAIADDRVDDRGDARDGQATDERADERGDRAAAERFVDEPAGTARPAFTHRPARHGVIGPFGDAQLVVGALVVVAVAVALVVLTTPLGTTNGTVPIDPRPTPYLIGQPTEGLHPGDLAPELSVTRADGSTDELQDLTGKPVTLAALRGRGVWINFWATWCPPCQAETPVLRDTYAVYGDRGLDIVAISVQESSPGDVQAYAQRYGLGYTIGFDAAGDIFRKYRIYALPTQLFVDPNGVIRAVVQGPLDPTTAAYYVEQILPGSAASGSPASGSAASGSVASGSVASGSVASGSPASGSHAPSGSAVASPTSSSEASSIP